MPRVFEDRSLRFIEICGALDETVLKRKVNEVPVEFRATMRPTEECETLSVKHRSVFQILCEHLDRLKIAKNFITSKRVDRAKQTPVTAMSCLESIL